MQATVLVLALLLAVVVSRFIARLAGAPLPLVQIALGGLLSLSGLSSVALDPQVFFVLMLPPLLFLDGWRIPKDDLRREAPVIVRLALGLVVFTVLGVGWLIHALVPALPLAVAFALAAVISPTDPIAVSAITARTPMPVRMRRILEGESLFNDASGLVCMRFAVAAALSGSFALSQAVGDFVWVALGGLATGSALTWAVTHLTAASTDRLGDDGGAQILITLLIPFGAYLLAERLGASGILAAVAAGIAMDRMPHADWQAMTRIRRTAVWDMVQLTANGSIFVLLGEQIPALVRAAPQTVLVTGHTHPAWLLVLVVLIVAALAVLRFVWVGVSVRVGLIGSTPSAVPPAAALSALRAVLAMSLAGVRGVVTLAGVLTLPLTLTDGTAFPGRDLAISLAAGVILVSLLLASVGLPLVLRGLDLPAPRVDGPDERATRQAGTAAALQALEVTALALTHAGDDPALCADAQARIGAMYRQRLDRRHAEGEPAGRRERAWDIERHLRVAALQAEREETLRHGRHHALDELVLRRLVREIDLQEARYSG